MEEEKDAPEGLHILSLVASNHTSTSAFNHYLNDARRFKDGTFTIRFRAGAGTSDQGAGPSGA